MGGDRVRRPAPPVVRRGAGGDGAVRAAAGPARRADEPLAGDADATAVSLNAGSLVFLGDFHLELAFTGRTPDLIGSSGTGVGLYVATPLECPEQSVTIVDEDISADVGQVDYRTLQGGARQMVISIPRLEGGATAHAFVTFEVASRPILPPEKTDDLVIPQRVTREIRPYLHGSPYIEIKHQRIRKLAKEIADQFPEDASDWEKVELIYDYMLDNVRYVEGPDKGAVDTLRDGEADCQGRSMVFIALCRANGIPARVVWVDGHVYAEFYLEDAEGRGWWFPVESAGSRAFGEMPLARTILQKGDNFRVPERPRERLRYASDYLIGVPLPGSGDPKYRFIREQMGN